MTNKPTYPIDYAIKRVRDAIDLAEIEGDFRPVRLAINDLEDSINSDAVDDAKDLRETYRSIISEFYPF